MKKERAIIEGAFGIMLMLMLALIGCSASTADRWQEQYDLGVQYLSEGNYEEAILAFTAAIEIDPMQVPAYVGRGNAYVLLSETEDYSSWPEGMTSAEVSEMNREKNLNAARADYEKAIEVDETDAEAYLRLADFYIRSGDYDKALEILQQGQEKADDDRLTKKIQEFEDGTITDLSGELRAVLNEKSGEGQPKYLTVIHLRPGDSLDRVLDNHKSNVVVILDAGEYEVMGFRDLDNVIISGTKGTKLVSYSGEDTVAGFYDCKGVVLKNLTIGHEIPTQYYSCSAGVLMFENTEATLENCDIFGCGLFGIYAAATDITAIDTIIRDCSESIMTLVSSNATFQNCIFSGNGYHEPSDWAMWFLADNYWSEQRSVTADSFFISFSECEFSGNQNPTFYKVTDYLATGPDKVDVIVKNCTFSGNAWGDGQPAGD